MTTSSKRYLRRKGASDYLLEMHGPAAAISPNTLAKWAAQGIGPPYVKFGSRVGYAPQDLDNWVQSRMSTGGGEQK